MITAHVFVSEVVRVGLTKRPTDLEKRCEIAVLDQLYGLSAHDARIAVLAVHAMMAWEHAQTCPTPAPTSSNSEPVETPTIPSGTSG